MSTIVYPENRKEVSDRMFSDIQNNLPQLNPYLKASVIRAQTIAFASRFFDIYTQQKQLQQELFPDTATVLDFIRRWGLFKGLDVTPASSATGLLTATGAAGSIIPIGTIYKNSVGDQYDVIDQDATIQATSYGVGPLTRSGTTATATTSVDHNFATGILVTMSGATESEYNGDFVITVTGLDTFTYQVSGSPATPATGSSLAAADVASVEVISTESGADKNLDSGVKLTLNAAIIGVDNDAPAQFTGIAGGADTQSTPEYHAEVINLYAHPHANSNNATFVATAKAITGVGRVWVFDATPNAGENETYFVLDAEENVIPSPLVVSQVKEELLSIKPSPMEDDDMHVLAPIPVSVDFVFTILTPDSQSMRDAITASLKEMFRDEPNVGETLQEDSYRAAIWQSIDPETRRGVTSFTLTSPVGDISIQKGELAIFGSISWDIN